MLIKEEWVQAAVDYLRGNSGTAAAAKGELVRADFKRKQIRSKLMLDAPYESPVWKVEAWAESQSAYIDACERVAVAEEAAEFHKDERNKSNSIIEAWKTQEYTNNKLAKVR